jgi:hypothetical protein
MLRNLGRGILVLCAVAVLIVAKFDSRVRASQYFSFEESGGGSSTELRCNFNVYGNQDVCLTYAEVSFRSPSGIYLAGDSANLVCYGAQLSVTVQVGPESETGCYTCTAYASGSTWEGGNPVSGSASFDLCWDGVD